MRNPANARQWPPRGRGTLRRRGIAMMFVLGLVAVASILSWAMLSASATRAQMEAATADSLEASYQADSGVSYAMYYLRYPEKSTVATVQGSYDAHYPGQNGVRMWSDARGTTDVAVTNTGDGMFSIRSTSSVAGIRRTTLVEARKNYDRYRIDHAMAINGNGRFNVPSNMTVVGPVVAQKAPMGATNKLSEPASVADKAVTPTRAQLTLVSETATAGPRAVKPTDRQYIYDGKSYNAEQITGTITGTGPANHATLNPLNVWYAEGDVTVNNATFAGTIVLRQNRKLIVSGPNVLSPRAADMPAVIAGSVEMKPTAVPARLTVNGAMWVESDITVPGVVPVLTGWLKVNGALLFGGASPSVSLLYRAPIDITYVDSVATIPSLSTIKTFNGIAVTNWRQSE